MRFRECVGALTRPDGYCGGVGGGRVSERIPYGDFVVLDCESCVSGE